MLGPRAGDRFPVLEGLAPGEKVAAAGAFLIDAESRLNPGCDFGSLGRCTSTGPTTSRHQTTLVTDRSTASPLSRAENEP